jgi:hypothetical protein
MSGGPTSFYTSLPTIEVTTGENVIKNEKVKWNPTYPNMDIVGGL